MILAGKDLWSVLFDHLVSTADSAPSPQVDEKPGVGVAASLKHVRSSEVSLHPGNCMQLRQRLQNMFKRTKQQSEAAGHCVNAMRLELMDG